MRIRRTDTGAPQSVTVKASLWPTAMAQYLGDSQVQGHHSNEGFQRGRTRSHALRMVTQNTPHFYPLGTARGAESVHNGVYS
jgi:hypothetical protein